MLDKSLTSLGVYLVLGQIFNQTLCVTNFTELILVSVGNGQVNRSRHYMLDILLCLFMDNYIKNQRIKEGTKC